MYKTSLITHHHIFKSLKVSPIINLRLRHIIILHLIYEDEQKRHLISMFIKVNSATQGELKYLL